MLHIKTIDRSAQDAAGDQAGPARSKPDERRDTARLPVLKSAKITIGTSMAQSVYDCVVLNESSQGALVDLGALISLPAEVTLQLQGGATYLARRCWSAGTKAGLEFQGAQIISDETRLRLLKIADVLQAQGVLAALSTLRSARFFDQNELRRAAEEAEAAYLRFDAMLTRRQRG